MENFEENLFLKANLEKEIPILRAADSESLRAA